MIDDHRCFEETIKAAAGNEFNWDNSSNPNADLGLNCDPGVAPTPDRPPRIGVTWVVAY